VSSLLAAQLRPPGGGVVRRSYGTTSPGGPYGAICMFSWFYLEVRMEVAASALPANVPWLGCALFGPVAE